MTLHLAANPTSQSASVAAPCSQCLPASFRRVFVCFVVGVSVGLIVLPRGHADDEDDDVAVIAAERQFVITEQQFDQIVFDARQGQNEVQGVRRLKVVPQQTAADFRKRLESALASEIQTVESQCSLTEAQQKKLLLAGKGDIHQFFSRVSEMRPKLTSAPMSRERYMELITELRPLQMAAQYGLIGETSLFWKTLRRTLTDEQRGQFQLLIRQRQIEAVETVVSQWKFSTFEVRLDSETRRKFVDVLVEQGRLPQTSTPYMQYIVLLEANRLEEQLRPLLNDSYWQDFQTQVATAKRIEPTLRRIGQWPVTPATDDDEITETATRE